MINLNDYTKEDLICILTKIGDGQSFEDAAKGILSKDMKTLVFKVHTAFCRISNCGFGAKQEVNNHWYEVTNTIIEENKCNIADLTLAVDMLLALQMQRKEVLNALSHLLLKHVKLTTSSLSD